MTKTLTGKANDSLRGRYLYADILRVSAIVGVVFLHVAAQIIYQFNTVGRGWWWTANVIDSCTRWAVPIFIMLSGMLLLDPSKANRR